MKVSLWILTASLVFFSSHPCIAEVLPLDTASSAESGKWHWPWDKKKHKDTKEAKADEVKVLPGWQEALPSRMFAGLVDAGTKKDGNITHQLYEHYFFVESEGNPDKDPLIVWTNGGPGASSFFGLFTELGPFYLSDQSKFTDFAQKTGIPSLFRNDYSWSKLANILIINSPPPVGYSYCEPAGPQGDGNSCGSWNDQQTAYHNKVYLESWFKRFPKFQNHDYYIIGESYAGVYVPTLVREILDHSKEIDFEEFDDKNDVYQDAKKSKWSLKKNLKGFAVGDGCMGVNNICGAHGPGPLLDLEFMRGHGQFPEKLYDETFQVCSMEELVGFRHVNGSDNFVDPGRGVTNQTCLEHLKKIERSIGPFFAYGIYDACWYQNDFSPPKHSLTKARNYFSHVPPLSRSSSNLYEKTNNQRRRQRSVTTNLNGAINDYPCGGLQAMFDWLVTPQVKQALHVDPKAAFFSGDNGVGFTYIPSEPNLMPFYARVVNTTDLRVLVYNGDTDPAINVFSAQNWTSHLGIPEEEPWRPWTLDGKQYVGGYVTRYANDFDFLTIRGAGHMVPENKPKVSLEFLSKWLKNERWQGVNTYYEQFKDDDDNVTWTAA